MARRRKAPKGEQVATPAPREMLPAERRARIVSALQDQRAVRVPALTSHNGSRISPVSRPSSAIAVLIPIGLPYRNSDLTSSKFRR